MGLRQFWLNYPIFKLFKYIKVARASGLAKLATLFTIFLAFIIFHETMTAMQIIGGIILLVSVYFLAQEDKIKKRY